MKANATVSVRRNTVRNKTNTKTRTTGKNHAKKNTDSPFAQTTAYLPEQQIALDSIPAATGRKATRSYAAKDVFARPGWRDGIPYGLRYAR